MGCALPQAALRRLLLELEASESGRSDLQLFPAASGLRGYSNWQVCSDLLTAERLIDRLQQRGFLVNEKGQASPEKQMPLVQSQSVNEPVVMRDQVEHPGTENEMQVDLVAKQIQRTPESVIYRIQVRRSALITRPTLQDGNWQARFASVDSVGGCARLSVDRRTWQTTDVHCVDAMALGSHVACWRVVPGVLLQALVVNSNAGTSVGWMVRDACLFHSLANRS